MNLYVTTGEIKTYLGLSGSSYDSVIAMLNKFATDDLNGILSVSDLALHGVVGEIHHGYALRLELNDIHAIEIGTIMEDTTEYTQTDAYDVDDYILHLQYALNAGYREVTIDYAAGWNAAGFVTMSIDDYTAITAGMTITITPEGVTAVVLTEGTDWDAATDEATTAANIVAAIQADADLGGSATGIRAFAIGANIYIVDKVPQQETSTIALSATTGITLSGGTLDGVDFPEGLREAIILLIAGRFAKRKNAGVKSYTIGTKTVTFADDADSSSFMGIINHYRRAKVHIV